MVNLLNGVMQDAKTLLLGGLILMAIGFVLMTWARTRSLVPVLGALLLGAVVIAGVVSYATLHEQVEQDIDRYTTDTNPPLADTDG